MEEFKEKINFIKRQFSTDDSNSYVSEKYLIFLLNITKNFPYF